MAVGIVTPGGMDRAASGQSNRGQIERTGGIQIGNYDPYGNTSTFANPVPAAEAGAGGEGMHEGGGHEEGGFGDSEWGDFMKGQWDRHLATITPVYDNLMEIMNTQWDWSQEDRARWESEFKPLEDALVNDANNYATVGKRQLEAGRAISEVSKAFNTQRQEARRTLEGYGIDPSQTRSQALDIGARAQQGAAQAAAGNRRRREVEEQEWRFREQAITLGDATAQRALQESQSAAQSGQAAGGLMNTAYTAGSNYILGGGQLDRSYAGLEFDYASLEENARQFNEGLEFEKEQFAFDNDTSGTNYGGVALGALQGYIGGGGTFGGTKPDTSITVSQPRNVVGGQGQATNTYNPSTTSYAEGGLVQGLAAGGMPSIMAPGPQAGVKPLAQQEFMRGAQDAYRQRQQQHGGQKPQGQGMPTPQRGALPRYDGNGTVEGVGGPKDDMVPARLSPGEFVVPQEVVSWKGEEFFHKLKKKAHEDQMQTNAENPPQTMPALPQQQARQRGI